MRILLLLSIAVTLLAQSPTSNGSTPGGQSIINSMLSPGAGAAPVGEKLKLAPSTNPAFAFARVLVPRRSAVTQAAPAPPCSVPLLKAQIRDDVNFTMQSVKPPTDKVDRIQVVVPAPACPEPPR